MKHPFQQGLIVILMVMMACAPQETQSHDSHATSNAELDMSQMKTAPKTDGLDMSNLKRIPSAKSASAKPTSGPPDFPVDSQATLYRCPMHPQIVQDHPGNCPICGMNLEKVNPVKPSGQSLQDRAAVQINPTRQQLIGVKTGVIKRREAEKTIRTVAQIAYNEKQRSHVHTKYSGWIEDIFANFEGQYIQRGQALLKIYSPDLVAAQEEYLVALKNQAQFQQSEFASSRETARSLVQAAREKLRLYDLTPGQIQNLRQRGQVQRSLTLYAPGSGYITDLQAVKGMRVTAGMSLYTLANLSSVWVKGRIYENDLPDIKVGQKARITLPFFPEAVYTGSVEYIDPSLDPKTRTANVRVVLPNPKGTLKPEMFAHLEIRVRHPQKKLMIPASAVIDTGRQQLAFVAKSEGIFEPVELKLGQRLGQDYELLQGPAAGTKVVTDAQFLIDSESQLQAVVGHMGGGGHAH